MGLTATYMFSDKFDVELLAATPFKHQITANGNELGETKQLPPTLSLQYYPMGAGSAYQPYFGIDLNYTAFFDEKSSLGELKLDDSWWPVYRRVLITKLMTICCSIQQFGLHDWYWLQVLGFAKTTILLICGGRAHALL